MSTRAGGSRIGWTFRTLLVAALAALAPARADAQVGKSSTGAVAGRNKVVRESGAKLVATIKPASGFVDDAFAFDPAGTRLAVIVTDAAQKSQLQVLDLAQAAKVISTRELPAELVPHTIAFLGADDHVLIVGGDARAPVADRPQLAVLVDASGKVARRFGPATDIAWTRVGKDDVVVAWTRRSANVFDVVATTLAGKTIAKRSLKLGKGGADVELLGWRDGYLTAVVKQRGVYLKKLDQRSPAREARWDARTGKITGERAIADPLEHKRVSELRLERPNQDAFVRVTEDLRGLERVATDDARAAITLPVELSLYEPKSLTVRAQPDGAWLLSLTVDPVNPEALAKKVAAPEAIDLYRVPPGTTKAVKLARIAKGDRGFLWQATSNRWAVLRKHKGFDRGGPELEIFELILAAR